MNFILDFNLNHAFLSKEVSNKSHYFCIVHLFSSADTLEVFVPVRLVGCSYLCIFYVLMLGLEHPLIFSLFSSLFTILVDIFNKTDIQK